MKKTLNILIGFCALLASLVGAGSCCNEPSTLVYEYHPVSFDGWNKTDTLLFSLPEVTQTGVYQGKVGVRTNARYPYQKIWIGVCQTLHQPDTIFLDTVCCDVMLCSDLDKNGIRLFLSECPLPEHTYQVGQTGTVKVFHILRREEVPGVGQVGLQIQAVPAP